MREERSVTVLWRIRTAAEMGPNNKEVKVNTLEIESTKKEREKQRRGKD